MSRKVVMEEFVRKNFNRWSGQSNVMCGLLLGQSSSNRDFVIHAVKTDLEDFNGPMREIPEEKISDHSISVTTMLPGGLWVLGVFLITSEELWNTDRNLTKCKGILKKVRQQLLSEKLFRGVSPSNDLILLQHYPTDNQFVARWFSYGEFHVDIQPVDLEYASLKESFLLGDYTWNFTEPYQEMSSSNLWDNQGKYWDMITDFEEQVNSSTLLLNGQKMPEPSETLKECISIKENTAVDEENDNMKPNKSQFNIFVFLFNSKSLNQGQNMMYDKIYVHRDCSIMEVCQAVKDDMVRSWSSRLHFHIKRLMACGGGRKGAMKKVSVLFEHTKVPFYSYIFKNEPLCLKRLHEFLHNNLALSKCDNFLLLDDEADRDIEKSNEGNCHEMDNSFDYGELFPNFLLYTCGIILMLGAMYYGFLKK